MKTCNTHPNECVHHTYGMNGTRSSMSIDLYDPLAVARGSVFCFQPMGDMPTRKGLFDSIMQGCIPVIFNSQTASTMYTWHWEEEFWNDVVVELDFRSTIFGQLDAVVHLKNLLLNNESMVRRKQELIRSRVFELQYSLQGGDGSADSTWPVQPVLSPSQKYVPVSELMETRRSAGQYVPQKDAFDITIDLALGWHSGTVPQVRVGSIPKCWEGAPVEANISVMVEKQPSVCRTSSDISITMLTVMTCVQ